MASLEHGYIRLLLTALSLLLVSGTAVIAVDEDLPPTFSGMAVGEVVITPPEGGDGTTLKVRIADDARERAQGMQGLPAPVIQDNPIWFVFPHPTRSGWHMHNVAIALDIAYIGNNGRVLGIERMQPGESGYGLDRPIRYALEVAAGQARTLGLQRGARVRRVAADRF